jgi:hypothetical protein
MELSVHSHPPASLINGRATQFVASAKLHARRNAGVCIIFVAFVALVFKLAIAYNTIGTNDAVSFYIFAHSLSTHGLQWTYTQGAEWLPVGPIFNHPPLTAYYLQLIGWLSQTNIFQQYGVTFPFLLRLPGIVADFIVVLVLVRLSQRHAEYRLPAWALVLFACSPVSSMVSGFHGNTDSVMVMFLFLAAVCCSRSRLLLCGLFLGLSCQIKVISLLFLPIFLFVWLNRGSMIRFLGAFALTFLVLSWEPITKFPLLFVKNVLLYGSFWGNWGITYLLRLTGVPAFSRVNFMNLTTAQVVAATVLKIAIVAAVLAIAWRRRALEPIASLKSVGYAWIIFFALSPGVCPQYMVWLAPFALFVSPTFYAALTAACSVFLFSFYNTTAHGLPWYLAISKNHDSELPTILALLPWAIVLVGAVFFRKEVAAIEPSSAAPV